MTPTTETQIDHSELKATAEKFFVGLLSRPGGAYSADRNTCHRAFKLARMFIEVNALIEANPELSETPPPKPLNLIEVPVVDMSEPDAKGISEWTPRIDAKTGRPIMQLIPEDPDSCCLNLPLNHPLNAPKGDRRLSSGQMLSEVFREMEQKREEDKKYLERRRAVFVSDKD